MDRPIDERFPEPTYRQAFLERRAAGDYDLARVPRPESLGTRYDASSDAFCAPEGMAPPLDVPVTDGGELPAVRGRSVSGRTHIPPPILPEPPAAHPLAFWFSLLSGGAVLAVLATLAGLYLLLMALILGGN
jgi:hypothetical protein